MSLIIPVPQTRTRPPPRIAPELYDLIIDNLHSCKWSLSTCSIVCQAWFPSSRYHLFYDINLTPEFVKFLCSSTHAMETIAPHIRNVALGGTWSKARRHEFDSVISFLLDLENVGGFSLQTWNWSFLSKRSSAMLSGTVGNVFKTVTALQLQYFVFPSFNMLTTFISNFSALEILSFDNVTWKSDSTIEYASIIEKTPPLEPLRPTQLKKLQILTTNNHPILNWLFGGSTVCKELSALSLPSLSHLVIPHILPDELPILGSVLRILGPCLQHLEIGFLTRCHDGIDLTDSSACRNLDLSHNHSLRTLRLNDLTLYHFLPSPHSIHPAPSIPGDLVPGSPTSLLNWVSPLLSTVSSPITELAFDVWLTEEYHLDLLNWCALSDILSEPTFQSLKIFQFRVTGLNNGRDDLRNWLLTRLPTWEAAKKTVQILLVDG